MPMRGVTTTARRPASPVAPRTSTPDRRMASAVLIPGDAERLAQLARSRAQLAVGDAASPLAHEGQPLHRLERPQQHRACLRPGRRTPGWRTSACRRTGTRTRCPAARTGPRSARDGGGGSRARPGRRSRDRPPSRRCGRRSGRRPAWRPRSCRAARGRPPRPERSKNETGSVAARRVTLTPPSSWPGVGPVAGGGCRWRLRRLRGARPSDAAAARPRPSCAAPGRAPASWPAARFLLRLARRRSAAAGSRRASICTTPISGISPGRSGAREPRRNRTPSRWPLSRAAASRAFRGGCRLDPGCRRRARRPLASTWRLRAARPRSDAARPRSRRRPPSGRRPPRRRWPAAATGWNRAGVEQRVLAPVQRHHPEAKRLVRDRRSQLAERLAHQLESTRQREGAFGRARTLRGRARAASAAASPARSSARSRPTRSRSPIPPAAPRPRPRRPPSSGPPPRALARATGCRGGGDRRRCPAGGATSYWPLSSLVTCSDALLPRLDHELAEPVEARRSSRRSWGRSAA